MKKVRLENPETGPQPTPDTTEELETLKWHLSFRMNDQEIEVVKQLFEHLQHKNLKIKASFYKLLAKLSREDLPIFCAKASVFFSSSAITIKDTGCLTSMLKNKKHWQNFAGREDSELEYLAGLDTLRAFSSMNKGKGLPEQAKVKAVLAWPEWKDEDGRFSIQRFHAFSSMNHGKGVLERTKVKAVLAWLNCRGTLDNLLSRLMVRLYTSAGVPDTKKLKQYEQKLSELFLPMRLPGWRTIIRTNSTT